jgi:nicotinamidase-related amidase
MSPRSAIVVIDLLKGFFRSNPTLPDPLDAKRLFATVRRVIDGGRERGVTIVFIKDNFLPEEVPIDKHFKIFGPHCIIGTPDAEIVDELDPKPGDFRRGSTPCCANWTSSGFSSPAPGPKPASSTP